MTYSEFIITATNHYGDNRRDLRFGQAVFNVLDIVRPDIANSLRGNRIDPFFKESVSDEVWQFIKERW
ncbi:MAG: hypothetical protein ACO395_07375 [Pontimonas sp.]|jgi:hypothetical protein